MKKLKRILFFIASFCLIFCLFFMFSNKKVNALSNSQDMQINGSWLAWGLPDSDLYTAQPSHLPLLTIQGDYNYDLIYVVSQELTPVDPQDPYYLVIDTFAYYNEILINPWDGYLFIYFDYTTSHILIYQAYYTNGNYLEISNNSLIADFSINYELSHDNPTTLRLYMLYKAAVGLGTYAFNIDLINNYWLNNWSINPYEGGLYDNAYDRFYGEVYDEGYNAGYNAGQTGENALTPIWNVLTGIFTAVGSIFAIELAPHVYLGYFILVPLFFAMVLGILAIWRRNF